MQVKPLGKRLLIKLNIEDETKSGLKLVRKKEEWQEETLVAEVLDVGPDVEFKEITKGSFVIIAGHSGRWLDSSLFEDKTVTHRMIDQDDIVGTIEATNLEVQ